MYESEYQSGGLFSLLLAISSFAFAAAAEVHVPPLGFRTIDVTSQSWSELKQEYKFKGRVGGTIRFAEIQDIYVLRCFMHVLNDAHIEKTVEDAIAPESEFLDGPVPERFVRIKEPALLTLMFKTRKGVIGLISIYPGMTIVEMNSRYGAVLNQQR